MKYYLIAGEASGDLHASHLMRSLKKYDSEAEFRFFGGDNMTEAAEGCGVRVKHYRELAYMGFIPVLLHLPTILRNMSLCKQDIMQWQPNAVILVDYAGFNLNIAKYLCQQRSASRWHGSTFYYIAPKLWAWKEYRIKNIKRDVDELFSILPFEEEFFEGKHGYRIHYVGNPTADEVRQYKQEHGIQEHDASVPQASEGKPVIALLAGSRRQEIQANLPAMLEATSDLHDYDIVIAGAPGIEAEFYQPFLEEYKASSGNGNAPRIVHGETYRLLSQATAALVTSGTATLETCLFNVPQVVCYKTSFPKLMRWGFNNILNVKYISLVNLIADEEVVPELFADRFSVAEIRHQLMDILPSGSNRNKMLSAYEKVHKRLGDTCAPDNAARIMSSLLL